MTKKITLKTIIFFATSFIALLSVLAFIPTQSPIKPFVVLSGSMKPKIYPGSIAIINSNLKKFKEGDIVTFKRPDNPDQYITHRIKNININDQKNTYQTKGDANDVVDPWLIPQEAIFGKVILSIPLVGFIVNTTKTKIGTIILIVIPLLLIAINEIIFIIKEIKPKSKKNKKFINIPIFIFCLLSIFIYKKSIIYAFFGDQISTTQNKITTDYWLEPITQITNQDLVFNTSNFTLNYSLDNGYNLDYVQLCYSFNLNPHICPDDINFKSTNGSFNFESSEDGIYRFYTVFYSLDGRQEDTTDAELKQYTVQVDTTPPTTNLNITNLETSAWTGNNLLTNGDFEKGDFAWNIEVGIGDHHVVSDDTVENSLIISPTDSNMYLLGFKDYPLLTEGKDSIFQIIQIPQNTLTNLSFWYRTFSYDIVELDQFQVQVSDLNNQMLENIITLGNIDSNQYLDTGWQHLIHPLSNYSNQTVKLSFAVTNKDTDNQLRTWTYLDDIKVFPQDIRISDTFTPELITNDIGTGILSTSTLPEINVGENQLTYSSIDIADNQEISHQTDIVVLPRIVIDQFEPIGTDADHEWVKIYNNSPDPQDIEGWKICDDFGGWHCIILTSDNSESNTTLIPHSNSIKFIDKFYLNNDTDIVRLFDNQDNLVDQFQYSQANGIWQRSPQGIGNWILSNDSSETNFNLVYKPEFNKATLTIFNIQDSGLLNYEILYTSNSVLKGIFGTANNSFGVNSQIDLDFFFGSCSTNSNCIPHPNIGTSVVVNITPDNSQPSNILTKTFKL